MIVQRAIDANRLNEIVNHPTILPWARGPLAGPLDLTPLVQDSRNILLMGEHGGVMYIQHQPGIYEAHTQVLPEGRGQWALQMVRDSIQWMFCSTIAVELVSRVPRGNLAARALVHLIGGIKEFHLNRGWYYDGKVIPADVYSLRIQDWFYLCPALELLGKEIYDKFKAENQFEWIGIGPEYLAMGMMAEMVFRGQPQKGVVFYNRMANMAGLPPVKLVTSKPVTVEFMGRMIAFRPNRDYWMM